MTNRWIAFVGMFLSILVSTLLLIQVHSHQKRLQKDFADLMRLGEQVEQRIAQLKEDTKQLDAKSEKLQALAASLPSSSSCDSILKPAGKHCAELPPLDTSSDGCTPFKGGMECHFHAIAPEIWGSCFEIANDGGWLCKKGQTISHYRHGPTSDWSLEAKDCPTLDKQVSKFGHGNPVIGVPIPVPAEEVEDNPKT
jgi:hypothetical protein